MWNRRHRWLRRLAAGFAFAGLIVPAAAQAKPLQVSGDRPGGEPIPEYNGYGYQQSPGVPLADQKSGIKWVTDNGYVLKDGMWVQAADQKSGIEWVVDNGYVLKDGMWQQVADSGIRFFDRGAYVSQPSDGTVAVRPDDRGERFTPSGGELPQVVAQPSTGFDWNDAGIGAGMAVGLMLLALGAALATRHANRKALAGA